MFGSNDDLYIFNWQLCPSFSEGQPESIVQEIEAMVRSYVEKVKRCFFIDVVNIYSTYLWCDHT